MFTFFFKAQGNSCIHELRLTELTRTVFCGGRDSIRPVIVCDGETLEIIRVPYVIDAVPDLNTIRIKAVIVTIGNVVALPAEIK
jgi:hypothetical protein